MTESAPQPPTADNSVRLAWPEDAHALAQLQIDSWPGLYAELAPSLALPQADQLDELTESWRQVITRPRDARQRVLVALERNVIVGFVLTSPAADPDADPVRDAELSELTVHPGHLRRGHGSRLLQAGIDTLRADRFDRATMWLNSTADSLRAFLAGTGWAPDSAHRELDLDGSGAVTLRQIRLHTSLSG